MPAERIEVEGLDELRKRLKQFGDRDLPKGLQRANKTASEIIARAAKSNAPVRSGLLQRSIRATATQKAAEVRMGNARVPYAAVIERGGRVGRNKATIIPRVKGGRVLGPAAREHRHTVVREYQEVIDQLVRRAGLD